MSFYSCNPYDLVVRLHDSVLKWVYLDVSVFIVITNIIFYSYCKW